MSENRHKEDVLQFASVVRGRLSYSEASRKMPGLGSGHDQESIMMMLITTLLVVVEDNRSGGVVLPLPDAHRL